MRPLACLAVALAIPACASQPPPAAFAPVPEAKIVLADPSKWPADDHSMCNWKGKKELEVSETAGPGALKPNVRRVYKVFGEGESRHKSIVCREIDTNLDGIKDVVRTFNAKGEAVHEEADTNYDGKLDTWVSFVNGRLAEEDLDTDFDGKVDVWKFYLDGVLARIKRDTNHDGKPDIWEIYVNGKLDRVGVDTGYDGHVDRWDRDTELQRKTEEAEMKARATAQDEADAKLKAALISKLQSGARSCYATAVGSDAKFNAEVAVEATPGRMGCPRWKFTVTQHGPVADALTQCMARMTQHLDCEDVGTKIQAPVTFTLQRPAD